MENKRCLNCRKKLIGKYFTAKFCNESCGREFRSEHKNRKKYEIKNMKKKCKKCDKTAISIIGGDFLCNEHFKTTKYELRYQSLFLKCRSCWKPFRKNKYPHNQKYCSLKCKTNYHDKINKITGASNVR